MKELFEKLGFATENWAIRGERGVQEIIRHLQSTEYVTSPQNWQLCLKHYIFPSHIYEH